MADDAPPDQGPGKGRPSRKARRAAKKEKGLVHSSQLDERLRRGEHQASPADKAKRIALDVLNVVAFAVMMVPVVGRVGFGPATTLETQTVFAGIAALVLIGNTFLFASIDWRALRGAQGQKILDKAKTDLQLTIVSIFSLLMVFVIAALELGALLVFLGVIPLSATVDAFAANFVLIQVIILLTYLMVVVIREINLSSYQPDGRLRLAANIVGPAAAVAVLAGVLFATGLPQEAGIASGLLTRQAVHIVMLGIAFEFLAMRIRMRLPSVWALFNNAVETAKRANPELKEVLQKRARTTYVLALLFVTLSMAFAGAIATGAVNLGGARLTLSLVIFYVGTAVIILGLVAVRIFQGRHLEEREIEDEDDLERLVGQKRRSPQELARMAVYGVTGFIALVCVVIAVLTFVGRMPWDEKFATDAFILALIFGAGPFGVFYNRDLKRIRAMDDKFPDFLRDLAESARAGMTLPRALVTAAHGTYGALTEDIRHMAAQVEWGVEFGDALRRFAERVNTPLIDRTVSLVVEAQRSGGNVVDVLTAASTDAREIKQIIAERNEQMSMYQVVVFIAFFVFIAVVLVLSAQFIPAFKDAVGGVEGQQVGGLQFRDFDPEDFNTLFFHAALIQAIGGGLVGGVLTKGDPLAGFMPTTFMVIASWLSFRVILTLMTGGAG